MVRRALVIGSQIEGLRGVDNDARRMAAMLDAHGFAVDLRIGADATRDGMLAGYDQLIAASATGDAALVYYCGHGGYASVPAEGRTWQCLAPTDLRAGTAADWRGITAWELSIKQAELTARTQNVTVILDCCHSAQQSRSDGLAGAMPRALPHPVEAGFEAHLTALRTRYGAAFHAVDAVSNPHAVRLVACGQSESAFEVPDPTGAYHGVFTGTLIDVLAEVDSAQVSWAVIISAVRTRVLRKFVRQRPNVEGPAYRGVFSLVEHAAARGVAILSASDGATGQHIRLSVGRLAGAAVGDTYHVVATDAALHGAARALGELELIEVSATTATARAITALPTLPADAVAFPLCAIAPRWPVAIAAPVPLRAALEAAIAATPTLRVSRPEEPALATLRIADDAITLEAAGGALPPAPYPAGRDRMLAHLADFGVAQGLRELEGEHGVDATELSIELGMVRDGQMQRHPDHGHVFRLHDRYYLQLERRGRRPLFVHVLGLGARGTIALLTHFARGGVVLDRDHPSLVLGQRADGAIVGVGLRWPDGVPRAGLPRLTELVVIATSMTSDVSGLETRAMATRSSASPLERTLAQLCDGRSRDARSRDAVEGYFVKRLSLLLDPGDPTAEAAC